MKNTILGRTGQSVSQLGYGSMGLRGPRTWGIRVVEDTGAENILNSVLDAGITLIDTAPDYGVAEERIGKFLRHRRNEFLLATKCGCDPVQHDDHLEVRHTWTPQRIRTNLQQSLQRLQTDHIDLLQFHGGDAATLQREGLIDLLQEFQQQGLIRWIGISSSLPALPDLLSLKVFDTVQLPWSCLAPQHSECMQLAEQLGMGVIVRGGIAQGGPDAEIQRPKLNTIWEQARLDEMLQPGMSRAELLLRCTLSQPGCHSTIVGTCNPDHLQENLRSAERGPLPEDVLAEIQRRVSQISAQQD